MDQQASAAGRDAAQRAIRAAREASNAAIAARDAAGVVMFMLPDVTVSVAHGPLLTGREASRSAFAKQFGDRAFAGYVREAAEVVIHDPPTRATERGQWTGRWRSGAKEHVMRGTYHAEWELTPVGWLIRSEVFVPGTDS